MYNVKAELCDHVSKISFCKETKEHWYHTSLYYVIITP